MSESAFGEAGREVAPLDAVRATVELLGAVREQPAHLPDLREGQDAAPLAEQAEQVDRATGAQESLAVDERGAL